MTFSDGEPTWFPPGWSSTFCNASAFPHLQPTSGWLLSHLKLVFKDLIKIKRALDDTHNPFILFIRAREDLMI